MIDLPGEDRRLAADLKEVYRIGSAGAVAEWEILGAVPAAGFDDAGNLYLLDSPVRVVIVGPDGDLVGQFGHPGEGPGEFRRPGQLDVWRSGRTVVTDFPAFHVFGPKGVFERMVRMEIKRPNLADLYYWVRAQSYGARPARDGTAILSDGIRKIVRTDLSSDEAQVEPFVEAWAPPGTEMKQGSLADILSGGVWGFVPPVVFDALPEGGIAFSDSSAYAIKVTGPSGEVSRVLRRPIEPQLVTDRIKRAEKERQVAELMPARTNNPSPAAAAMLGPVMASQAKAIEDMRFFPEVPIVHALRTTWDGSLWVQRRGEGPNLDRGPIDILTPTGRYVGTIDERLRMPDEFGPDGLVVFIEKDEFDVPVIVVKRLPPKVR